MSAQAQLGKVAEVADGLHTPDDCSSSVSPTVPVTRTRLRTRDGFRQNRFVVIGAGALVIAFLLFVAVSVPHKKVSQPASSARTLPSVIKDDDVKTDSHSLLPITNAAQPEPKIPEHGLIDEEAVEHTATKPSPVTSGRPPQVSSDRTLASVPPFPEPWQAPPYTQDAKPAQKVNEKPEIDGLQKSSLAYVRSPTRPTNVQSGILPPDREVVPRLGLPQGTRLRAHLESAASTSVRAPVVAVVEYNYERAGEILVPAGSKAIGHIQQADRSGYISIEFDTLLMPDESSVPIQAVATDLNLSPPKGKVEGMKAGKNLLLRSLSGIGQAGALLLGHGTLNQPLSESDMLRERVSNNIGQASDERIAHLALSEHPVVNIPAATPVYVILGKSAASESGDTSSSKASAPPSPSNIDDLRQLLQLQKELQTSNSRKIE